MDCNRNSFSSPFCELAKIMKTLPSILSPASSPQDQGLAKYLRLPFVTSGISPRIRPTIHLFRLTLLPTIRGDIKVQCPQNVTLKLTVLCLPAVITQTSLKYLNNSDTVRQLSNVASSELVHNFET
ncbi:hypothetical protein E2C01_031047 [Portunus trituberculatus]|uniref:Uncharacterized protein n=1 Tax=Portunus trituberculatus TaxID=210409 RepID=A0A5B7ESK4_PORTR|nr:hypothetical protein [Portunus trituberculatus]